MHLMKVLEISPKMQNFCELDDPQSNFIRFWLFAIFGGWTSFFGMISNALLSWIFIMNFNYRHSPFFFMGFVALFDSLLDFMFLLTMTFPVTFRFFELPTFYVYWLLNAKKLMLLVQVFKIASVFCLIIACYERYLLSKHWSTSGFDYSVRWILLSCAILLSVIIKVSNPTKYIIVERKECHSLFTRLLVERAPLNDDLRSLFDMLTVTLPFITLVLLNGGIIFMIRKQNVQQLRSLITQLTLGKDLSKIRRQNLRAATNTLLFIITIYLLSNVLTLFLTFLEFFYPGYYETHYPETCRFLSELAHLLAVVGNALRPPAHLYTNKELREQMYTLVCGKMPKIRRTRKLLPPKLKGLENIQAQYENPWFTALLTTARDRVAARELDLVSIDDEECREPLFSRKSTIGLNPLFDRDSFRRLSNVGIV